MFTSMSRNCVIYCWAVYVRHCLLNVSLSVDYWVVCESNDGLIMCYQGVEDLLIPI